MLLAKYVLVNNCLICSFAKMKILKDGSNVWNIEYGL